MQSYMNTIGTCWKLKNEIELDARASAWLRKLKKKHGFWVFLFEIDKLEKNNLD